MRINKIAIEQRITVCVLLVLISCTGIYSYVVLPREAAPEVVFPYILVGVTYQGVSPEDMENLITIPIERKLTGIAGVKKITSSSVEGMSSIAIQFNSGVNIDVARQKVRDKVDTAKQDIPKEADDPFINEINISEMPIVYISLSGDIGIAALHEISKDVKDQIEAVKGVLSCKIIGGVTREIQIEVDPERVAQYGVTLSDLVLLTQLENVNTPGGAMDLGEAKFLVRIPGEFKSPAELTDLVVKRGERGTVYLRDIATIKDTFKDAETYARVNGKPVVTLTVSKRAGENIVQVSDKVKEIVDKFRSKLPQGVEINIPTDQSVMVRDMVSELQNSIVNGLVLVVVCIIFSLGFINSIFVAIAIPVSMLITFTILNMMGVTLNFVVLFALIFVLGHLVDVSVVVVENTHRHMQQGMGRLEAAYEGAAEVAWPIIGSTLTAVAAFFPLLFWPGIMGDFMVYFPMTVSIALLASLFVGMVVNPALTSLLMPIPKHKISPQEGFESNALLRIYGAFLRVALRWRTVTTTAFVTLLVVIIGVFVAGARVIFMPDTEPRRATVDIDCPQGTNLDTSDKNVRQIEARIMPELPNMDYLITNVGSRSSGGDFSGGGSNSTHINQLSLIFPKIEDCKELPSLVVNRVRDLIGHDPGLTIKIDKEKHGPPTGPPVNIEISGDDFKTLAGLAQEVKSLIKDIPGLVDVRDDYDKGKPEVRVDVNRQQAWLAGLNTQYIGLTVKAAINGRKAGDYREGDEDYDVIVRFPKSFRENLANIESMNLINLSGHPIPFSAVAKLEQGAGLGSIKRIERKRTVTVSGNVEGARTGVQVLDDVRARLKEYKLPTGYSISYTGENEDMQETQTFMAKAFVLGLLLITLVMVIEFNSVLQPLIIMSTVIMSLSGVFLSLLVFDLPFGIMMTSIACIGLAGIVVNNGIVLLDFINRLRARGYSTDDAIVIGGQTRFRPVILTALTTVVALIPTAFGISYDFNTSRWIVGGESSQFWGPMAKSVTVGLMFATFLTLVLVPMLYSYYVSFVTLFQRKIEPVEQPAK